MLDHLDIRDYGGRHDVSPVHRPSSRVGSAPCLWRFLSRFALFKFQRVPTHICGEAPWKRTRRRCARAALGP